MENGEIVVVSPLSGPVVPLERVPDPVFAGGILGDGLAIEPLTGTVVAPCDGTVASVHRAGHAFSLTALNGAEILVHVGVDTVRLGGRGFRPCVQAGARVVVGDRLLTFDLDAVAQDAPSLQTSVIVTNGDRFAVTNLATDAVEAGVSALFRVGPRTDLRVARAAEGDEHATIAIVRHANGLHARPAAHVVAAARGIDAEVTVSRGDRSARATSVVALMALNVDQGDEVSVRARGRGAAEALAAVVAALQQAPAATEPHAKVPTGERIHGVCAAPGLALGTVVRLDGAEIAPPPPSGDRAVERERLTMALAHVREALAFDIADARARGASSEWEIFLAHRELLEDPSIVDGALGAIARGEGAGAAYRTAARGQAATLLASGSELIAARAADLTDLERRVLAAMHGKAPTMPTLFAQSILVADDLTVSELARLPRERVVGVATARGGATSHAAIVARTLGVPALVALGPAVLTLEHGRDVLLDADAGVLDPAPNVARCAEARAALERRGARRRDEEAHEHVPAILRGGPTIEVAANVETVEEARAALAHGADGVGLVRTELLFVDRTEAPTFEEQRIVYQGIVDALGGKPAVLRTLDVAGDKPLPFLGLPKEDNPALGLRGIRAGLARPDVLDTQLRAMLAVRPTRAARILLPMVTDSGELEAIRARIEHLARELDLHERPIVGAMIEVPAAALLADRIARDADFLSIGTNDLTQYALAMDRCHPGLAARLDGLHPAVLRLIASTVEGAARYGRWVGVCGALAADLEAIPVLVGLGVTELSVSPGSIAAVKARIRTLDFPTCRREARALLEHRSAADVRARCRALWPET